MAPPAGDPEASSPTLCRDCDHLGAPPPMGRCPICRSPRLISHNELTELAIAHVDCDAFYAAVEKRDAPELVDQPVIIGGGRRGVVSTCCYIARSYGVRSAMPMFKALDRCPKAVVIKPNMAKYIAVSREIRAAMEALTPAVEPLSLDEAFLDLSGTERLHGRPPVVSVASLARRIEESIGVTVSVGLAPNKFLAKIASDLDKPRGFAVIGAREAASFLADKPVSIIWGVGAKTTEALARAGYATVGALAQTDPNRLTQRFGALGARLSRLANGEDARSVTAGGAPKSVSAESTFETDVSAMDPLLGHLWRLSERVAVRLKAKSLAGRVVTLKMKRTDFRLVTRRRSLDAPTQLADQLYRVAEAMLRAEGLQLGPLRLIGVGVADLTEAVDAPAAVDLFDQAAPQRAKVERTLDDLRDRFGDDAIIKGRSLR